VITGQPTERLGPQGISIARPRPVAHLFERHYYAAIAWLFVLVAIAGFAPRSVAILAGTLRSPPLVVHLHAAVMASWVVLLAMQATLALTNRMDLHRKWGLASLVVAPLVLTMLIVVTILRQNDAVTWRFTSISCCCWSLRCCTT
jgi:hypothetical protein